MDLNTAAEAELQLLPRIGPALAAAIARDRSERGRFERVEDLLRVRGVGPKLLERVRPWVVVTPLAKTKSPN